MCSSPRAQVASQATPDSTQLESHSVPTSRLPTVNLESLNPQLCCGSLRVEFPCLLLTLLGFCKTKHVNRLYCASNCSIASSLTLVLCLGLEVVQNLELHFCTCLKATVTSDSCQKGTSPFLPCLIKFGLE